MSIYLVSSPSSPLACDGIRCLTPPLVTNSQEIYSPQLGTQWFSEDRDRRNVMTGGCSESGSHFICVLSLFEASIINVSHSL